MAYKMDRVVYDAVPDGLIDLPTAAARYGVTRNALHKRRSTGSLTTYGRLKGGSPGGGSILLSESEVLKIIADLDTKKQGAGSTAHIPIHVDTGCNLSRSCLDCRLPKCKHDMTLAELAQLTQNLSARGFL